MLQPIIILSSICVVFKFTNLGHFEKTDGFELVEVIAHKPLPGEELPAVEGSSRKTTLDHPLGVAFSGTTSSLYICCFKSGLKFCTATAFALRYCQEVQKLYLAIGYKKKISPCLSFHEKMESTIQCSSFLAIS